MKIKNKKLIGWTAVQIEPCCDNKELESYYENKR